MNSFPLTWSEHGPDTYTGECPLNRAVEKLGKQVTGQQAAKKEKKGVGGKLTERKVFPSISFSLGAPLYIPSALSGGLAHLCSRYSRHKCLCTF